MSGGIVGGVTSAQITTALGYTPENVANKGAASGYADLDSSTLIPASRITAARLNSMAGQTIETQNNKGAASGYCDLDGSVMVPLSRLGNIPYTLLSNGTLAVAANTWSITPTSVKKFMRLILYLEYDGSGNGIEPILQFNNDTGNNYDVYRTGATSGSGSAQANINPYASLYTSTGIILIIDIVNITASHKQIICSLGLDFASSLTAGTWLNTLAQITSIQIGNLGTGKYTTNSRYFLFGSD